MSELCLGTMMFGDWGAVLVFSPLNGGWLTGEYRRATLNPEDVGCTPPALTDPRLRRAR